MRVIPMPPTDPLIYRFLRTGDGQTARAWKAPDLGRVWPTANHVASTSHGRWRRVRPIEGRTASKITDAGNSCLYNLTVRPAVNRAGLRNSRKARIRPRIGRIRMASRFSLFAIRQTFPILQFPLLTSFSPHLPLCLLPARHPSSSILAKRSCLLR